MKNMTVLKHGVLATAVASIMFVTGCSKAEHEHEHTEEAHQHEEGHEHHDHEHEEGHEHAAAEGNETTKLLNSYADMALAAYSDSLAGAKKLQTALDAFVAEPTQANLDAAKAAYSAARQPYSQTEVFRFDEGFVGENADRAIESVDGWEGQLNAWPLDEALIDYVSAEYEGEYNSKENIINSDSITVGSIQQDTSAITPELLAEMNEIGGSEANVTSGYHAIEFLLWGQDTNGTGEGAGNRPLSDYATEDGKCTSGDTVNDAVTACQRRGEYLKAAAQLLVNDLEGMVAQWQADSENTLRSDLLSRADGDAVQQIMYQMGSLSLGELASERMQVAFVTGSTEDEHECFSDLTHNSYAMNAQGIKNVFEGKYANAGGYGIKQFLIDNGKQAEADELQTKFDAVTTSFDTIVEQADKHGIKIDQMIATVSQAEANGVAAEEQEKRRAWMQDAITKLQDVTGSIEAAAASVGIDNLDADSGSQF